MTDIWFTSDLHLFHKNLLSFKRLDGSPLRPEFTPKDFENPSEVSKCLKLMNDTLIDNINSKVKEQDKLYNLGDVTFYYGDEFANLYSKINTKKHRLIPGNHDNLVKLIPFRIFKKVDLWKVFKQYDFVISHIPLKRTSFSKVNWNVHGHNHQNNEIDKEYINISVEQTRYTPIHLDEILQIIKQRS